MGGTVEMAGTADTVEVAAFDGLAEALLLEWEAALESTDAAGAARAILAKRRAHRQEERLIILTGEFLRCTNEPLILQRCHGRTGKPPVDRQPPCGYRYTVIISEYHLVTISKGGIR
jgi:hypothetical protein